MKLLQAMKDGYVYSDILLKLYLQSLRQEGRLMYRDIIPYTPEMIASVTHHQVGTIEKAMKIFEQMGFIEILDNGAIYMLDIQNFIGQSSSEADRIRNYRNAINAEKKRISTDSSVTDDITKDVQMYNSSTPDIRDKSIEIKDKENINTFAQSPEKQGPGPEEPPIITLPLNTGEEYPVFQSDISTFAELYPAVDILQAMRGMKGWLLTNPTKRKTKRGIGRFINSWLAREQDKGGARPVGNNALKPKTENMFNNFLQNQYDFAELEKDLLANFGDRRE